MEAENHSLEKETHLPNLHFRFNMVIFRGYIPSQAERLTTSIELAVLFLEFRKKLVLKSLKLPHYLEDGPPLVSHL